MDNTALTQIVQLGSSITTAGALLLAWILERRRADRLETYLLETMRLQLAINRADKGEV